MRPEHRTQWLDINDAEVFVADGGSGPPLLLTHGFSATAEMWRPQRPALEPLCHLITWDLRGHGRTRAGDDPKAYSHTLATDDMARILDHFGHERAIIGGLSLGGFLSLEFQRRFPERTQALVLMDTGPGYRNPEAREQWNSTAHRWAEDFEKRGLDALRGRSREMQEGASVHESAQGLAHAARGMLAQSNSAVIDSLPGVTCETLIIVGAQDEPYLGPCSYMARKIPGAEHIVIDEAGHSVNLDQPGATNDAVVSFLERIQH